SGSGEQTMVERYNVCPPSPTPTSSPTVTGTPPTAIPTSTPTHCPLRFEDVPDSSAFHDYIRCLACRGIVSGYACSGPGEPCNPSDDPYFRPSKSVSRGQVAKIVALSAGINRPASGQTFQDVPIGSTFYTYTEQLVTSGVMSGYPCSNPEP